MRKKLVIHLGTGKTGTTAIQKHFFENRSKYRSAFSLHYCTTGLHDINHHHLCFNWDRKESNSAEKVIANIALLSKEISHGPEGTYLISSEYFPGLTRDEIGVFFAMLKDIAEIQVIIYFRRQDQFLDSWYAQIVKARGYGGSIEDLCSSLKRNGIFDYYEHVDKWACFIGKENVLVRPYEKNQFFKNDLISDFLSALGFEKIISSNKLDKDPNPSLTREQLVLSVGCSSYLGVEGRKFLRTPAPVKSEQSNRFLAPLFRKSIMDDCDDTNCKVANEYIGKDNLFDCSVEEELNERWKKFDVPSAVYVGAFLDYWKQVNPALFHSCEAGLTMYLKKSAIKLENECMESAFAFMKIAQRIRPNGPFIRNKLAEYDSVFTKLELEKV